jgi:N-acetylglucosamine-6-phosphate deacetylase
VTCRTRTGLIRISAGMIYLHGARAPDDDTDLAAVLADDKILAIGPTDKLPCPPQAERLDARGRLLAPGLIDLQLNGAFGLDFTAAPETIWEVGARLPCYGVTAFLPTIITSPLATVAAAQRVLQAGPPAGYTGAAALGLHLEGPFLNPAKRGAHDAALMRHPGLDDIADWSPAQGVRLVTLAPELPGALEVIGALRQRGVLVSAGHSMATYAEAQAGLGAGIRYGTHLFNAMPPFDHRAPGLAAALLTDPQAIVGIIPDGIHLHPAIVKLVWQSKGPGQVNLVTDAMAALGNPPGRYQLGSFEVVVDETSARLNDGRLAGSILSLDQAVRNLVAYSGCSPSEAIAAVTEVPAHALQLGDRGVLRSGARADMVLLTSDLGVAATLVGGRLVWGAPA